jgi:hypothetical protein
MFYFGVREGEVKKMNRKLILAPLIVSLMLLAVAPVMASQPKSWTEKNNDKFETFQVLGRGSFSAALTGDWEYIPSLEKCNKVVVSWDEVFTAMQIMVDGHTYVMGADFTYKGRDTMIFYDPVFPSPPPVIPFLITGRMMHSQIDYEYTFNTASIKGTLRMQAIIAGQGDVLSYSISSL